MPIHEYVCENCEERHEALQNINDPPLTLCPLCYGKLTKIISRCTFHLKGTGWFGKEDNNLG